jgi:hypothetical protein
MARRGNRHRVRRTGPIPPYIQPLPFLGTTWHERGPAYWRRRVGLSALLLLAVAVNLAILGGVLAAARESSRVGFTVACAVVAVLAAITGWLTWRRTSPARAESGAYGPYRATGGDARRAASYGAGLGTLARSGSAVGGLLLTVGGLVVAGPLIVMLVRSLDRYLYVERAARARLAWYAEHDRPPGAAGPAAAGSSG